MVGHNCDRWENVYNELTYYCSHQNFYISQPSYLKLFDHIYRVTIMHKKTLYNTDRNTEIKYKKIQPLINIFQNGYFIVTYNFIV